MTSTTTIERSQAKPLTKHQESSRFPRATTTASATLFVIAFGWVAFTYAMGISALQVKDIVENCPAPCATDVPYLGGDPYVSSREEQQLIARGYEWATLLHVTPLVTGHIVCGACAFVGWLLSIAGRTSRWKAPTCLFLFGTALVVIHAVTFAGVVDWVTYYTD